MTGKVSQGIFSIPLEQPRQVHESRSRTLCRTANPSAHDARFSQGRPLGFMQAWARQAHLYPDKSHVKFCRPTLEERQQARSDFGAIDGLASFSGKERPKRGDEADEPAICP